jgi:hypothetical protein
MLVRINPELWIDHGAIRAIHIVKQDDGLYAVWIDAGDADKNIQAACSTDQREIRAKADDLATIVNSAHGLYLPSRLLPKGNA